MEKGNLSLREFFGLDQEQKDVCLVHGREAIEDGDARFVRENEVYEIYQCRLCGEYFKILRERS